jgi:hypothetical protein
LIPDFASLHPGYAKNSRNFMSYVNPIWLEGQRRRWLRNDAHLWVRHDAHRFAPPGSAEANPGAVRTGTIKSVALEDGVASVAEQEALRADLEHLHWLVKDFRIDLAIRRLRCKYGYNPDQPRDDRGRWTDNGGSPDLGGQSLGKVRLAAMTWQERRRLIFGQGDLFGGRGEGGGGGLANSPSFPPFKAGGPTAGVLQSSAKADVQFVSGTGGPASLVPNGTPGFDRLTRTHVEGQAAAYIYAFSWNERRNSIH